MKVALYARVSTEDKGQNPENQLDILRGIAKREGLEVYREYVDYASGKDPNRPQFQMMREAAKRREFEAIYAVRLDRIMRSVTHLNALLQEMKQYRVSLRFSDMVFDYDNPSSMLVFQVLAAIAEWERGIISARTREGLQHAKNQGKKLGRSYRDDLRDGISGIRREKEREEDREKDREAHGEADREKDGETNGTAFFREPGRGNGTTGNRS